jgi:hypothetical protein
MATIVTDPPEPVAGEPVTFDVANPPDGADSYVWSGQGAIEGFSKETTVTYQVPGTFNVSVTITGGGGILARPETSVTVIEAPEEPEPEPPEEEPPEEPPEDGDGGPARDPIRFSVPTLRVNTRTFEFLDGLVTFTAVTEVGVEQRDIEIPPPLEFSVIEDIRSTIDLIQNDLSIIDTTLRRVERDIEDIQARLENADLPSLSTILRRVNEALDARFQRFRRNVVGTIDDVRSDIESQIADFRDELDTTVAELDRTAQSLSRQISRLRDDFIQDAQDLIDDAVVSLRSELTLEAFDIRRLRETIQAEITETLPVQFQTLGEAFAFLGDLRDSSGLQNFIDSPTEYILDSVFSEVRRRLGGGILDRLKSLTDDVLDVALSSSTKERLRNYGDE